MKKFFKNNLKIILAVGSTAVICISGTAFATLQYQANSVSYTTSKNGNIKNVEDALNDLYKKTTVNKNQFYSDNILYDQSGNGYNAVLLNGLSIKTDTNNQKYLSFDGIDDYAQICTLPSAINWSDGFTIEFEAQYDEYRSWSRIFDFSNGANSDNIWCSYCNTNQLYFGGRKSSTIVDYYFNTSDNILVNKNKYKIEYIKENNKYKVNLYLNNVLLDSNTELNIGFININRTINYLGKSAWGEDPIFKGKIYNLMITQANGNKIIEYKLQ